MFNTFNHRHPARHGGLTEHSSDTAAAQNKFKKTKHLTLLKIFRTIDLGKKRRKKSHVKYWGFGVSTTFFIILLLNRKPEFNSTNHSPFFQSFNFKSVLWCWTTSAWSPCAEISTYLLISNIVDYKFDKIRFEKKKQFFFLEIHSRRHWSWSLNTKMVKQISKQILTWVSHFTISFNQSWRKRVSSTIKWSLSYLS